jgi:uncharacterized protein YjbI with pentapeptide repeats
MPDCDVDCHGGVLKAGDLATPLEECAHDALTITSCRFESDSLGALRLQPRPDMALVFQKVVRGTINLTNAQLRAVAVITSNLDEIDLHDATVDRVRIAATSDPMPDAYGAGVAAPACITLQKVDARGCHARVFALLGAHVDTALLTHARVEDTLDLTWTQASTVSMRFVDASRFEGARLRAGEALDLLGAHFSQASLALADLGKVNAETASVDHVLSLSNTAIRGNFDGYWFSAGALVFNGTRVGRMDLSYSHFGLLDVDPALGFESGPVKATGMHVDAIAGDVRALANRIDPSADSDGAFHSLEAALRSGGRFSEANAVAFRGSHLGAGVAGKLPPELAGAVVLLLAVCFAVAAWCCRSASNDVHRRWRICLCALDIVLPSFVDIGALSAWTNYGEAGKKDVEITLDGWHRTVAFIMRIVGTIAFTYLLLYIANLRG